MAFAWPLLMLIPATMLGLAFTLLWRSLSFGFSDVGSFAEFVNKSKQCHFQTETTGAPTSLECNFKIRGTEFTIIRGSRSDPTIELEKINNDSVGFAFTPGKDAVHQCIILKNRNNLDDNAFISLKDLKAYSQYQDCPAMDWGLEEQGVRTISLLSNELRKMYSALLEDAPKATKAAHPQK